MDIRESIFLALEQVKRQDLKMRDFGADDRFLLNCLGEYAHTLKLELAQKHCDIYD